MSFSQEVKEELSKLSNLANKQEVKMEFLGYLASNNISTETKYLRFSTENDYNIDRFSKIIRNIGFEDFSINVNGKLFFIKISKKKADNIEKFDFKTDQINDVRAFIRGLFMGSGSINNPEKKYHLECGIREENDIKKIVDLLKQSDINFKNNDKTIYTKEGEEISKFLALIGASKAVINFEEIRVIRDIRNNVNRKVNCETANLNKTVNAAVRQIEDIKFIYKSKAEDKLSDNLKEIANLRMENPDISLVELGKLLKEPIGKSGVNHRLKKIQEIANELRGNK